MLSPIRNRFGIPGVISVIALVFAMLGGAYAASNDSGKADASAKAKRGPRGPKGPAGPAGPAGPQGPAGAKGDNGANGDNGAPGKDGAPGAPGAPGADGKSPEIAAEINPGETDCGGNGGVIYSVEGSGENAEICNGKEGKDGKEGSPWTAGGVLPAGATEQGSFAIAGTTADTNGLRVPIGFALPLAGTMDATQVHFFETLPPSNSECKPTTQTSNAATPRARAGELCVFLTSAGLLNANTTFEGLYRISGGDEVPGADRAGAMLAFAAPTGNTAAYGSYALTAPNPIVTGVSPAQGPAAGGTSVTITGQNLWHASTVKFGTTSASGVTVNAAGTEVTCTAPAHAAGTVDVTVTISGYVSPVSAADHYTYE